MYRLSALIVSPLLAMPFAAAPVPPPVHESTWPMFGGTPGRNMVNLVDRDIPHKFVPEQDCIWSSGLGSTTHGGPVRAEQSGPGECADTVARHMPKFT